MAARARRAASQPHSNQSRVREPASQPLAERFSRAQICAVTRRNLISRSRWLVATDIEPTFRDFAARESDLILTYRRRFPLVSRHVPRDPSGTQCRYLCRRKGSRTHGSSDSSPAGVVLIPHDPEVALTFDLVFAAALWLLVGVVVRRRASVE